MFTGKKRWSNAAMSNDDEGKQVSPERRDDARRKLHVWRNRIVRTLVRKQGYYDAGRATVFAMRVLGDDVKFL